MNNRLALVRSLIVLAFVVFVLVVLLPTIIQQVTPRTLTTVTCFVGSEKDDFLKNPEVVRLLADRYGLEVSYSRVGSIEQAFIDSSQVDCLWPSNTSALEIYRSQHQQDFDSGGISYETIFNSPIVLFSWTPLVQALVDQGLFVVQPEGYTTVDTTRLIELLTRTPKPTWAEVGVDELFGSFNVITSDPARSNSGNMFYGLFANMLAGGQVASLEAMRENLPALRAYYESQGYMEESSGILFERFVNTGMGAHPIIANYESLLIEFIVQHREQMDAVLSQIHIIYPTPTVWSSHPLIARTDAGRKLLEALRDERLQQIAWEQHGFRSGLLGIENDPSILSLTGIPAEITSVIPLPRAEGIIEMLDFLRQP
ncbi:MAG: substrate-binding domain-containing protein [Anaerolineae bacterium]|nr:substrate-binding domain-containing protein [Anaerolineae bacterium]NUQ04503.1 substrate-binding domain-containing protein [Anaerolineae bacterium]